MVVPDGVVAVDADEVVAYAEFAVEVVGRYRHVALGEPAGGGFHDGECLGKYIVERFLYRLILILHQFVRFGSEGFLLGDGYILVEFEPDLGDAVLERFLDVTHVLAQCRGMGAEVIV